MRGQYVFRTRGYYVVLTRIGRKHRDSPADRWEIELTSPRGRTRLRYKRNLFLAARTIYRTVSRNR